MLKVPYIRMEKSDAFLCFGAGSLFFGTFQIYPPAAYILIGIILIALAVVSAPPKKAAE